jgi:hypothetical protein
MAANPFDAAHRKEQTQAQLEAALAAYREMLHRLRRRLMEAQNGGSRTLNRNR